MWDVWFGRDANYSNIQSTPNDSYSSIDENYLPIQNLQWFLYNVFFYGLSPS